MDKQTEIKTLQSLKGDTYFNQFFNNHDIDQMCENINNDFGIEYCCQFFQEVAALEKQIEEMKKAHQYEIDTLNAAHKKEMEEFGKALITENENYVDDIYQTLENKFGKNFIINTKHSAQMELSDDEIQYLVDLMNKNADNK